MSDDLITPDSVNIEEILEIYESAYLDVALDEESEQIRLKEEVIARAFLSESRERLQLVAYYALKDDAQRIDQLELVNRINDNYVLIRAGIDSENDLWLDYTILLKGGVTRKAIIQATRIFLMLVPRAVTECDEEGIVE